MTMGLQAAELQRRAAVVAFRALFGLVLAALTFAPAEALTLERITLPIDAAIPATPALTAYLARPDTAKPAGAVVALHGCSGLVGPKGDVLPIYLDWAERLAASGYVVIFPDSFGSRGLGAQCTVRERAILPRDRAGDAAVAARWLQT